MGGDQRVPYHIHDFNKQHQTKWHHFFEEGSKIKFNFKKY